MNDQTHNVENMPEVKNNSGKELRWHFWFLVAFSAFLLVTFAGYLPLKFLYEVETGGRAEETERHHAGGVVHGGDEAALYHEEGDVREGIAVNLNVTPVPLRVGQIQTLDFFVNEKPGNIPIPASNLEIEHSKLMHVIGVRSDMNEFFHIHPEPSDKPGIFTASHVFEKPGLYKIWSEIKSAGVTHSFGHPEISVAGVGPLDEKKVSFGRNVVIGLYRVALKIDEPVVKGHEHNLSFDIHTFDGEEVETEDYLAAKMHLTIIKDDWKRFIHTHPVSNGEHHALLRSGLTRVFPEARAHGNEEIPGAIHEEGGDEIINFRVVFPEAGLYKIFAQFRPKGINLPPDEALTAAFWVKVEERAPSWISTWWILLIASVVLIVLLSWVINRFLRVDPKKLKAVSAN